MGPREEHSLDPDSWRGGCPDRPPAVSASARLFWGAWPANPGATPSNVSEESAWIFNKKERLKKKAIITSGSFSSSSSSGLNASAHTAWDRTQVTQRQLFFFFFFFQNSQRRRRRRRSPDPRWDSGAFWYNNYTNTHFSVSFPCVNQTLVITQSYLQRWVIPAETGCLTSPMLVHTVRALVLDVDFCLWKSFNSSSGTMELWHAVKCGSRTVILN